MKHSVKEQELLRRIADLPREIPPQNDPWPAILARIEESRERSQGSGATGARWLFAAAASVALALVAGLLFAPRWGDVPTAPGGNAAATPAASDFRVPASVAASEAEYQAAFREFITVGRTRPDLSPQTIERIEAGWADLRDTEDALTAALADTPGNTFLTERMMELRARQLGFLQQLAAIDQDYRRLRI